MPFEGMDFDVTQLIRIDSDVHEVAALNSRCAIARASFAHNSA
jgi:hypothetical protein